MNFVDREVKLSTENYTDGRGFTFVYPQSGLCKMLCAARYSKQ